MCKEVGTGEILAMKVLKKKVVIKDDDIDAVLTENRVLQKVKHPFLTVGYAINILGAYMFSPNDFLFV